MVTPIEVAEVLTAAPEPGSSAELDEADLMAHHRPADAAAPDEEPEAPQVVGAEVAVVDVAATAMAQAEAQADPNLTATQLQVYMRQAELLAGATIIPRAYRGEPANILVASLMGRTFGWDALTAMRNGHVIEGVWSMKPEAMLALVRRAGHKVEGNATAEEAWATGTRGDDGTQITVRWTMDDATRAKLVGKDNWKHYPASMLWARVVGQLCRMLFPDVLLGISYTPDELGADLDERGEVIDVQLAPTHTDGWNTPAPAGRQAPAAEERLTSDETHAWLTEQAGALPEPHQTALREAWKATPELQGWTVRRMARRHAARARGMVNAHWAEAIAAGHDRKLAVDAYRAARAAVEAAEQDGTPAAQEAAQEAQEDVPVAARGELTEHDREAIAAELAEQHGGGPAPERVFTPPTERQPQERVEELMDNLERAVEAARAERQAPHADQDAPVEPPPAVDTTAADDAAREREHWRAVMGQQAELVRAQAQGIPDAVVETTAADVKALHHTAVNQELADAGLAEDFPASSPIDLRRMVVARLRLAALRPGGS